jgi:L-seryl-tRNA(Ser) seleniumtransferase
LFLDPAMALKEIPTLAMLGRKLPELRMQAERMAEAISARAPGATVSVIAGASQMGSGSLPTQELPTRLVAVQLPQLTADELAQRLRGHSPPVFTRIRNDRVLVDPRTLLEGEEQLVVEAIVEVLGLGLKS